MTAAVAATRTDEEIMRSLAALLVLSLGGCGDLPTTAPRPNPDPSETTFAMIARIGDIRARATPAAGFGDTVVTVGKGGFILNVTFQNAGLVAHTAITDANYELRLTGDAAGAPLPERVVYTPFDNFDGSIYWVAPGQQVETWIGLWHKSAGHYDAGPYRLYIKRRPHSYTQPTTLPIQ